MVKTFRITSFSVGLIFPHDARSLDTGIFSGSQKLAVSLSHTSLSSGSSSRFQLIALNKRILLEDVLGDVVVAGALPARGFLNLAVFVSHGGAVTPVNFC